MTTMGITTGNSSTDGSPFNGWFVGTLNDWVRQRHSNEESFGSRDSAAVEMKWGVHRAGETRADWAPCSDKHTMSLLVRGKFLLRFRSPHEPTTVNEQRLLREGDYAIWGTDVEHTWLIEEDAVIFTVRWREPAR